jgi:hypothetical protein
MSFKDLKPELVELQTVFGTQLQAAKAPKGAEGAPFPVKVLLEIDQPLNCSHWDVTSIKVLLIIEGPELDSAKLPFKVEFPQSDLPLKLRETMSLMTLAHWSVAVRGGAGTAPLWKLADTFRYVETNYDHLLRQVPEVVDCYIGCDMNDVSMRRYTITPQVEVKFTPAPVITPVAAEVKKKAPDSDSDSEADEENVTEEEKAAQLARKAEKARKRRLKEQREDDLLRNEITRRRADADAARERGDVKVVQPTKKELEESRKSKQGVRTSKTGPKASKYSGEGSAIEKAAKAKK